MNFYAIVVVIFGKGLVKMLGFFKKNTKAVEVVPYIVDKKERKKIDLILKPYLKNVSFGNILSELGFEQEKQVYLKRDNSIDVVSFYYSLEDGKFNEHNKIAFGGNSIRLRYENCLKVYNLKNNICDEDRIHLKRYCIKIEKNVNGIVYKCHIFYGSLIEICVKNNDGKEIKFCCEGYHGTDNLDIINENELEEYMLSLNISDSVENAFKKLCQLVRIDEFFYDKISLGFYKNGDMQSGYSIERKSDTKVVINVKEACQYKSYCREILSRNPFIKDGDKKIRIAISNDAFSIVLEILNNHVISEVNNEFVLREYLLNLKFPVSIDELYKKIREISLGDVSKYIYVKLESYDGSVLTDEIHLANGKLKFFKTTRDGKVSSIDEDGKFSYITQNEKSSLSLDITNDAITRYEYTHQDGIDSDKDDIYKVRQTITTEAKDAKVRTRNLVDELLNKKDSN